MYIKHFTGAIEIALVFLVESKYTCKTIYFFKKQNDRHRVACYAKKHVDVLGEIWLMIHIERYFRFKFGHEAQHQHIVLKLRIMCSYVTYITLTSTPIPVFGDVAQMVKRSLSMREVRGSIPRISMLFGWCCSFEKVTPFLFPFPFFYCRRKG